MTPVTITRHQLSPTIRGQWLPQPRRPIHGCLPHYPTVGDLPLWPDMPESGDNPALATQTLGALIPNPSAAVSRGTRTKEEEDMAREEEEGRRGLWKSIYRLNVT